MCNSSTSFLQSDDQQAGQVQKVKKVIQVQWWGHKICSIKMIFYSESNKYMGTSTTLTVGGLGRDVGGNERKKTKQRKKRKKTKTKKTALNEVISRAGGVGGNVGLVGSELAWWWTLRIALRVSSRWILYVATAWRRGGVLVVEVDGDRGHEFMARRQGSCSGDMVCRARRRLAYRDGMASGWSFRAAGYQWWRLMVTGAHKLMCTGVLGGFARRGDGGELEATAGGMGRCVAWRRW
ncbi:hypothetical protein EDB85DRAFT_1900864 [Lactarius pseudohatsudake]|nr:hypothetical protein EDB85DRAFT_1900864 [Lactarius pseudohatsudake]